MNQLTPQQLQMALAGVASVAGVLCLGFGLYMLVVRGYTAELKVLAAQTARLGEKGIAQDITTLVNTSTQLVGAINGLIRTSAGIGVFLVTVGAGLLAGAYFVLSRLTGVGL